MLSFRATSVAKTMKSLRRDRDSLLGTFADSILKIVKRNTPIDKGRARRGWRRTKSKAGFSIINRVPYIGALEKGRSKQAPKGIVRPTVEQVKLRRRK